MVTYRRGNRFDAAEAWRDRLKPRADGSPWRLEDTSECQYCAERVTVKGYDPVKTKKSRSISRSTCQKGSLHFSELYAIGSSLDVRSAAFVIQKLGRATIAPYEREIERQLKIRARLKRKVIIRPSGVELLRLVNQLIKFGVSNDSQSTMPDVRGEEAEA